MTNKEKFYLNVQIDENRKRTERLGLIFQKQPERLIVLYREKGNILENQIDYYDLGEFTEKEIAKSYCYDHYNKMLLEAGL